MAITSKHSDELLTGPVGRTLMAFALPLFLANLCQTAYNIIDMAIVGHFVGSTGLSGVTVGTDVVHFLLFVAVGMSGAAQVIIARHIGSADFRGVSQFIGTLLTSMLVCGIAMAVLSVTLCPVALDLMSTPPEAYGDARAYLLACSCGMPFVYLFNSMSAVFRAFGDSKTPMVITFSATVANIALDLVFIVLFGWGVLGAGLATVIGQVGSFVAAGAFLKRHQAEYSFVFDRQGLRVDPKRLKSLVRLGVPMGLQNASVMFSKVFVSSWINSYGLAVSAATGVGVRLASIGSLYTMGIAAASSIMLARCLGAQDYGRMKRTLGSALLANGAWIAAYALVAACFPAFLFGLFTTDEDVLQVCMQYVPVLVLELAFMAVRSPMVALINASGKGGLNLLIAVLDGLVGRIGLSVLLGLGLGMGYFGFWLGGAFAGLMPAIIGACYFASGKWKRQLPSHPQPAGQQ